MIILQYIGIIGRTDKTKVTFNQEVINVIYKYGYIPLGIIATIDKNNLENYLPLIKMCDGFILQGGTDYYDIDLAITKYLYQNNIPTLGICLGMQTMAMCFDGIMKNIKKHKSKKLYVHQININKSSKLYNIIKKEKIMVNSRHKSYIEKTNLKICATNKIIEAIEDDTKNFFIGVQWHPETLMDENSILLFNSFFKTIKSQKNEKI